MSWLLTLTSCRCLQGLHRTASNESFNAVQRITHWVGRTPTKPPNTLSTMPWLASLAMLSLAKRPHVAILIMGLGASSCGKCSIVANSRCRLSTTPCCAYIVVTLAVEVSKEHRSIRLLPNFTQTKLLTLLQKTCSTLYHPYSLNYFTILLLCHGSILRHTRPGLLRVSHVFRERTRTDALRIRRRLHRPESESANGELKSCAPLKPIAKRFAQMYSSLNDSHHTYSSSASFPQYIDPQPQIINSIEFTDLTRPQMEDRRRRRSHTTQDKESISNMRIVSTNNKPPLASVTITYHYPSSAVEHKTAPHNAHSASAKKSTCSISSTN